MSCSAPHLQELLQEQQQRWRRRLDISQTKRYHVGEKPGRANTCSGPANDLLHKEKPHMHKHIFSIELRSLLQRYRANR